MGRCLDAAGVGIGGLEVGGFARGTEQCGALKMDWGEAREELQTQPTCIGGAEDWT